MKKKQILDQNGMPRVVVGSKWEEIADRVEYFYQEKLRNATWNTVLMVSYRARHRSQNWPWIPGPPE